VAVAYSGTLRRIVHAFKYDGRRSLSVPLGGLMRDAAAALLADADCLVPVPLHVVKRISRGFNQAGDLARQLRPPVVTALWRTQLTRSQVGQTAQERRHAHGTLAPWPLLARGRRDRFITGRVVVVVDDVRTTGSTLDECAVVLKNMGALEVRAVALAQTPLRPAPGQAEPAPT
jgi:predicted amidophosphoribosyltransferase